VICNLDSTRFDVYLDFNLIEARAAAILTPHLMRHAPAVFLDPFPVPLHILVIKAGKNDWVIDKLLEQVFFFFSVETQLAASQFAGKPCSQTSERAAAEAEMIRAHLRYG
jgi:hypothetical protein